MASAPSTRIHSQPDKPYPKIDYAFPDPERDFPALKNDLLLRSASNTSPLEIHHPPIWVMRQAGKPSSGRSDLSTHAPELTLSRSLATAGRYLPEFHTIRANHSFFAVCRTPQLACELTMQPIRRYSGLLDASIIFSDILVVPQAMGFEVQMLGGVGPHFPEPLKDPQDAQKRVLGRQTSVFDELKYVFAAITLTRKTLGGEVPIIGFSAAPWTLFTYMVEGGGSKTWEKSKRWIYQHPENAKAVLQKIAEVCAEYLVGQVQAGAQVCSQGPVRQCSLSANSLITLSSCKSLTPTPIA